MVSGIIRKNNPRLFAEFPVIKTWARVSGTPSSVHVVQHKKSGLILLTVINW